MEAIADFDIRLKEVADKLTVALDQLIPPASGPEEDLMRAMRHAALANGKRMRPFFLLETGAMFDAPERALLRTAAALECVHCYSLVHDDLPVWMMTISVGASRPCTRRLVKRRLFWPVTRF